VRAAGWAGDSCLTVDAPRPAVVSRMGMAAQAEEQRR